MKEILRQKLDDLLSGRLDREAFVKYISNFPFSDESGIKLDFQRALRRGLPEVVFGQNKSLEQLRAIAAKFREMSAELIMTRVSPDKYAGLAAEFPDLLYHEKAAMVTAKAEPRVLSAGRILVLSAGASDQAVAEEAYVSARYLGNLADREYDLGVACLDRILSVAPRLNDYSVLIVAAGMEGALPSVVAGLTATPVIAVPTSIGYGANLQGVSTLLAMLNSCSGGVSVVNIDNGFGAAYQASLINRKIG